MKISIFGLGYVGCVSAGCFTSLGHSVIGVDVSENKVGLINNGKPTIIEKSVDELIRDGVNSKNLFATTDYKLAVKQSDISFICVGTPSTDTGHLNMEYIYKVAEQIGEALAENDRYHVIVIRSTVIPGTNLKLGELISDISGKSVNSDFCIVSNPEFLREGNAVYDFFNPPLTVLASNSQDGLEVMKSLYREIDPDIVISGIGEAEFLKFVNNSFHALKVAFTNEVGNICKKMGVNSIELMELFKKDKKLNISEAYFKPGFSYGGSCLPKDLKAINTMAHDKYVKLPVLNNIEYSNSEHKNLLYDLILSKGKKKVGVIGISFKQGTDDLRDSPIIDVIEKLIGKGFNINIYDKNVSLANLIGTNKEYILGKLPHISSLLTDNLEDFLSNSELVIINSKSEKIIEVLKTNATDKIIIDLIYTPELKTTGFYEGICW